MVSLRDGKTYDPSADTVSGGTSRRRSTAPASAQRTATRRSSRLNQANDDADNVPFTDSQDPTLTPARGKRQRPQNLEVLNEPHSHPVADSDDLDSSDVGNGDQGFQLQEAAAMDLPADEPSPSAPSAKKPRIPRTPTPSKKAAAASKQRQETLYVSIAAAMMMLVAAVAIGALLPQAEPYRQQIKTSVLQTAAHTNAAYLQPLKARSIESYGTVKTQLSAAAAAAQRKASAGAAAAQEKLSASAAAAQQHAQAAYAQAESALLQAHTHVLELVSQRSQPTEAKATTEPAGSWPVDGLSSILPAGSQWAELAADIADKLQAPAAQRNHKAPALLLACGSEDDCHEAAAALAVLPPKGEACTLTLNSANLASGSAEEPAAALQALLAPFLRRCPQGLVVFDGVESLPVAAVPALHNALSELGGFQHDGKVDGSKAAYALLLQMQPEQVAAAAAAEDSASADASIKEAFFNLLTAQLQAAAADASEDEEAHWAAVERAVATLHRRIEFAAPVRMGPSSEAAMAA